MDKKLALGAAALVAMGAVHAQSSVTLFGILDATLEHVSNSGGASTTKMVQGGYNRSRLGFRGVEDLGGGLSASFWLEGDVSVDDGTGTATNANNQANGVGSASSLSFNARSTVSLSGNWGELRLGRDYTPQFWSLTILDPFSTRGVGTNVMNTGLNTLPNNFTTTRASNSIGYLLPANLGGLYGQVQYYLGENSSAVPTKDDGSGAGARVGYNSGPVNVVAAYGVTNFAAGDFHQGNIAAAYKFNNVLLEGQVSRDHSGATRGRGWLVGGIATFGASDVRFAYSHYQVTTAAGLTPEAAKLALGYVYNLSKRTAVYATIARVHNSHGGTIAVAGGFGAPAANQNSSGFDLGLRTSF